VVFGRLMGENAASRSGLKIMSEKISKVMADKIAAIAIQVNLRAYAQDSVCTCDKVEPLNSRCR